MNHPAPSTDFPLLRFTGRIHLITSDTELTAVADELAAATELGFDTETRPSFKKGEFFHVSLLQLASENDAYLIRLRAITQFGLLKNVFENNQIIKVGVAIRDDLRQLQKLFDFKPENFIELQDVAKKKGLNNFGLKGMTEEVLQARLSKKAKITNWDAPTLTEQQITYAATDAWVGLQLFRKIRSIE